MENSKLTHAFTVDKQEVLSILLSQAAISLQNVEITSNLEKQVQARTKDLDTTLKNIRKDIDVAKKIQMGVLPSQLKFPFPIEIEFYPQSDVSGDLYDITELNKNSHRILIIDATGHGVQGALITMAVKNEYDNIKFTDSPSELLQVLNKKFTNKFKSINALFSAVVVDIDLDKNEIIYSSAGHPAQYLIQDAKIISLEKTGRIIGLSDNSEYKQHSFSFQKGDRLYLFSDGIYERFNSDKEEFGEERFMDLLLEKNSIELSRLYPVIDAKINQFVDGLPPDDDITFITVEF